MTKINSQSKTRKLGTFRKNTRWLNTLWENTLDEARKSKKNWQILNIPTKKSWGESSETTVAQKCSEAMEIQKYHQRTDQRTDELTWVGTRDTCVFKNKSVLMKKMRAVCEKYILSPGLLEKSQKSPQSEKVKSRWMCRLLLNNFFIAAFKR